LAATNNLRTTSMDQEDELSLLKVPDPKVYIVILNYKQWQVTIQCLLSVLKSIYTNYTIIVIDNDSQNNSLESLSVALNKQIPAENYLIANKADLNGGKMPFESKITLLQNDENRGFAAGNNLVIDILKNEDAYIWLLNPDMIVLEDTLLNLVDFAKKESNSAIIGAVIKQDDDKDKLFCYGGAQLNFYSGRPKMIERAKDENKLDFIYGGCLLTHLSNFKKLGLLPEQYFLYWEETDWCYTAKLKGHPLKVCAEALCYDKISTSIGKGYLSDYYYARNALYFIAKFRKFRLPGTLFFMSLRWMRRLFSGQWGKARGMFWGTIDFLKSKRNMTH
jgi:GT2 family glycosyltransferase